ncbi:hypothetical protein A9Q79_01465 [Methylophaga sp. 42_25_T18]|nr:hypothetical protein A9Q79_01465 [Methylophaga sp. 42_25_T18]OUR86351.1 hypothetical protein A9Q92_06040 [Methylophaga sp. 42_8_T64]
MVDLSKDLNSKRFLFTYLIIVGFLLVLWVNRLPLMHEDKREIPVDMRAYLKSPPRHLPHISLSSGEEQVLTNEWFLDKWSFVYFSHGNCLPACRPSLDVMQTIQSSFANKDFQFLVIGLDGENETAINHAAFLASQQFDFNVATTTLTKIEELGRAFVALFLTTTFEDGSYIIEQEHHVFVVDPKGRVYATFRPPFDASKVQAEFLKLRYFYARTE